ncbi:hypothetical protein ABZ883_03260 [Streptomyces sp. NPDC046977]|uniref:hypothetical protein n=1 Tax=Streptomyces sp. NPDC046977 TaxID=3154703 RepID=UPI0033C61570
MTATPTVTARVDNALLIARCPYCQGEHTHGRGTGHVVADCLTPDSGSGYVVIDPDPR